MRVPKENIIGEENRGWYAAMTTLDFERSAIGSAIGMKQTVESIVDYARDHVVGQHERARNQPDAPLRAD